MTVISNSFGLVRTFVRECKATGVKSITKDLGGYMKATKYSPQPRTLFGQNCKKGLYSVEKWDGGTEMVTARDYFRKTSILGRLKNCYSQLMSKTGDAYILPPKKGFWGIGKQKGFISVSQSSTTAKHFTRINNVEDMCLRASGTLNAPENPILYIGEGKNQRQVMLTMDKAKDFIDNVLRGDRVSSTWYNI